MLILINPFIIKNSKISHKVIYNQIRSPSGWDKSQYGYINNTDKGVIHKIK